MVWTAHGCTQQSASGCHVQAEDVVIGSNVLKRWS